MSLQVSHCFVCVPNTGIGGGCFELSSGQIMRGRLGFLINSRVDIVPSQQAPARFPASIPALLSFLPCPSPHLALQPRTVTVPRRRAEELRAG